MNAGGANEGYVKYAVHLTFGDPPEDPGLARLNEIRTELHDFGLVGVRPDGVGYGNVSLRAGAGGKFIISGTKTGGKRVLAAEDYCRVDAFDLERNEVFCTGRVPASSEAMSHGAVYRARSEAGCVIHVHSRDLFAFLLAAGYPRTSKAAAFGTVELAREITALAGSAAAPEGIFATEGHEEGVIAYGRDCEAAFGLILDVVRRMKGGSA